jgi:hypothetical protein
MSGLRTAMCVIGRHSGDWSLPGSRCDIVRVCSSCGKREEQTRHVWGQFSYVDDERCDQVRRCERCGSTESRAWHEWGPWLYQNLESDSPQIRTCLRCRQAERSSHTMR